MRIRMYKKCELAKLYFPNTSDHSAVQSLRRAIKRCQPLYNRLQEIGFIPRLKYFNPAQVKEIVYYLGEP